MHAVIDLTYAVPNFCAGETQRADSFESFPAGKGVSVSLALATGVHCAAEQRAVVVCGAADIPAYRALFDAHGITSCNVLVGPSATRRHVTIVDPLSGRTTHIQVKGTSSDVYPCDFFDTVTAQLLSSDADVATSRGHFVVVLSGSLPPALPAHFYADAVMRVRVKACGATVIVDTSGPALAACLAARPFAIKPNRTELVQLLSLPPDTPLLDCRIAIQDRLCREHGIAFVMASDGPRGVLLCSAATAFHAFYSGPSLVGPLNDQGCGDSLVAGFAFATTSGLLTSDPSAALRLAVAMATANLLCNGAGIMRSEDVARLTPLVQVRELTGL